MRLRQRFAAARAVSTPILLALVGWLLLSDPAPWRLVVTGFVAVVVTTLTIRVRRLPPDGDLLPEWQVGSMMSLPQLVLLATGGLVSPLLPLLVAPTFITALFERPRAARAVASVAVASLWVTLALHLLGPVEVVPKPLLGDDGRPPGAAVLVTIALAMSAGLVAANIMGTKSREAFDEQLDQVLRARDDALNGIRERMRELTSLSGELAHELKNPLASVKGLAALLAKDVNEGKPGERLGVLRREVDRMQSVLDEFLNFSRPLVPLAIKLVSLGKLAREVADLHEGIARERKIDVRVDVVGTDDLHCDPRKIEQVLVNLLQNALDAAPAGTRVEVRIRGGRERVTAEVLDAGSGLDPVAARRVFEVGFTTKERGNGLGLALSRTLARAHGGDVELSHRGDGPGCRASLELPTGGPDRSALEGEGARPREASA